MSRARRQHVGSMIVHMLEQCVQTGTSASRETCLQEGACMVLCEHARAAALQEYVTLNVLGALPA
jgi:hypothetical protein